MSSALRKFSTYFSNRSWLTSSTLISRGEVSQRCWHRGPGSLVGRFRKCGKVSCHCAQPASEAHGPSWSLTRAVEGKTVTKVIPPGSAVEQTKAQIAEYRRFRKLVKELIELNVQICDQKLEKGCTRRHPGASLPARRTHRATARRRGEHQGQRQLVLVLLPAPSRISSHVLA